MEVDWNKQRYLEDQDKIDLAKEYNVEYKVLCAVMAVESSGSGFYKGKIKIQFEPYHFRKRTGIRIANGVEGQRVERKAYQKAHAIDDHAAKLSTSWGLGQIMGFNYKTAGYKNVETMVAYFGLSEYYQLKGMLEFIKSNPRLYKSMQEKDWATFAKYYNGKNYEMYNYDKRLQKAYEKA